MVLESVLQGPSQTPSQTGVNLQRGSKGSAQTSPTVGFPRNLSDKPHHVQTPKILVGSPSGSVTSDVNPRPAPPVDQEAIGSAHIGESLSDKRTHIRR